MFSRISIFTACFHCDIVKKGHEVDNKSEPKCRTNKETKVSEFIFTQKSYGKYRGTQGSLPDLESVLWYTEGREEKLGKSRLTVHV